MTADHNYRFVSSSPNWHLSGVNTFTGNLFGVLKKQGQEAEIVLTEMNGDPLPYPLPDEVTATKFPRTRWGAIRRRQNLLKNILLAKAPCVYLPNYDFNHVPVVEVLPPEVQVVLTAHSDEDDYYRMIASYGHAANAIVAVSRSIEDKLRQRHPEWDEKIVRIPYGVSIPNDAHPQVEPQVNRKEPNADSRLHVVYSGRLSQHQKRIFDLVEVILNCRLGGLPIRFSLAGSGPDSDEVKQRLQPALDDGIVTFEGTLPVFEMNALFADADVVILTSDYEGLPLTLLEAMARRCVPVVSQMASGIDELVKENVTGRIIPIGDIEKFTSALNVLSNDRRSLHQMADKAAETILSGPFNIETTAASYRRLLENRSGSHNQPVRRRGLPDIPIHYTWSYRIGKRLRTARSLVEIK